MDNSGTHDPVHQALDHVARMCIDENFLDEAERLLAFLEMADISPYTAGLLRIWARSQRGLLRDALRNCNEMIEAYPDSSDVLALMAVLRFACGEHNWRALCERLMEMPGCRPESRQVAASLLDGTFGRKNPLTPVAAEPVEAAAATTTSTFDYAQASHYLRG
jgi:hypothetical protein